MTNQAESTSDIQDTRDPQARLIAAARSFIAEQGYEAASVKAIAQRAGVNQGLVHYYFGSKDALLLAVLNDAAAQVGSTMHRLRTNVPADQLGSTALTTIRERVRQHPEQYRLSYELYALGLHNPALRPGLCALLASVRQGISTTLQEALKHPYSAQESLAAVLLACFDGLALQYLADPTFDLDAAYATLSDLLAPHLPEP